MDSKALHVTLEFLRAAERLKDVTRTAWTTAGNRESVAAHTWRLALMALVFERELAGIDVAKLLKICIIHDLGEAIGGDISALHQPPGGKAEAERRDLLKLLEPLPEGLRTEITSLWDEYEAAASPEARAAKALDKLETIMQHNQGDNPADFDYAFNLEYGRRYTSAEPLIAAVREILDEETRDRAGASWREVMSDSGATGSSRNSRFIRAPREDVYRAFLDPQALSAWLAPDTMTGTVHEMDARAGGGYVMSLFYPPTEEGGPGKTADLEDRFRARFVELSPPERIVEVVTFDSDDPAFSGEMTMVVTLRAGDGGTDVVMEFSDIPPGIRPEDNEAGTRMSLEKLARYLEPVEPDQPSPESRLRDSWRANAGAWTDAVREGRIESRRLGTDDALLETITARAPGRGPARVLDVGCGEGWLARALEPHGFDVVGIDGSEALIRAAERLGGGSFQVVGYDELVDDPGVMAGPFDAVVCNFSLLSEHVAPVLRALADRLAPDSRPSPAGALIIQTVHPFTAAGEEPYRDGWREETFTGFGDDFAAPMPWYYRTVGSWIRELRAAGLAVVECREPLDPRTGRPLSLIMAARRTPAARHSRGPADRG